VVETAELLAQDIFRVGLQWQMPMLSIYFRFRGVTDMAGLATGSARSRMTHLRHWRSA
jgi:hypothetical protein